METKFLNEGLEGTAEQAKMENAVDKERIIAFDLDDVETANDRIMKTALAAIDNGRQVTNRLISSYIRNAEFEYGSEKGDKLLNDLKSKLNESLLAVRNEVTKAIDNNMATTKNLISNAIAKNFKYKK